MTIKSVAIIGAGAAGIYEPQSLSGSFRYIEHDVTGTDGHITGAATAAAFAAEQYFGTIRVFERKGSAGGTWFVCYNSFFGLALGNA